MKLHQLRSLLLAVAVAIIIVLSASLYQKFSNRISIAPLGSGLVFSNSGTLTHFFEPQPNTLGTNYEPDWLTKKPVYTINRDSLNERFDYATTTPPDTYRIITLGDSFTYGLFVDTPYAWPEVLEDLLNERCDAFARYEVINLGMTGYDIRYGVERFKVRGMKYDPDLVLWFLKYDDFDLIEEHVASMVDGYRRVHGFEKSLSVAEQNQLWSDVTRSFVQQFGAKAVTDYQRKALSSIDQYFQKSLVLVTLPGYLESQHGIASENIVQDYLSTHPKSRLHTISEELNGENLLPDSHPSRLGHQAIASDLFTSLTRAEGEVRCN